MSNVENVATGGAENHENGGPPLVFLRELDIFGSRRPQRSEWLLHDELYITLSKQIESSHIKGLQRVCNMWRIYLDNIEDKVILMADGVKLRGKNVPILGTNPGRLDSENTIKVCVKNIPLSVEDGVIARTLTLLKVELISHCRDKLRIAGKLTNCENGDRVMIAKASTLKEPLPRFIHFGQFIGRVTHFGQNVDHNKQMKCTKCLKDGHTFNSCNNDWVCRKCNQSGHKIADCDLELEADDSESETDTELQTSATPKDTPKWNQQCVSVSRSRSQSAHSEAKASQGTIIWFLGKGAPNETPNRGRPKQANTRSPVMPVDELEKKVMNGKKGKHKK